MFSNVNYSPIGLTINGSDLIIGTFSYYSYDIAGGATEYSFESPQFKYYEYYKRKSGGQGFEKQSFQLLTSSDFNFTANTTITFEIYAEIPVNT